MSYYDNNGQWPAAPAQNTWEHQASTPVRTVVDTDIPTAGANGPQPQDEFAFSYQFDEVDRAFENLSKSGKTYSMSSTRREFTGSPAPGMTKHHGRMNTISGPAPRPHSMNAFDEIRNHGPALQGFYASQRHTSSRGSNEAEQVMQAKRRLAAQRERELRNHHTEQQFQRTVLSDANYQKSMSEEETRQLIARQRSALYGEGPFAEKTGYIDETGAVRTGVPAASGPSSLRGASPMTFDISRANPPPEGATATPISAVDASQQVSPIGETGPRPNSTTSPQPNTGAGSKGVFDGPVAQVSRTSTSSPADSSKQDLISSTKSAQNPTVAPIGTRPSGTPVNAAKRSTTPLASPGGWGRGNNVWGQSSGLGAQASVWG